MSDKKTQKGKTFRLENMETQFVSLVRAGANRQTKFMLVKRDNDAALPGVSSSPQDVKSSHEIRAKQYGIEQLGEGEFFVKQNEPNVEEMYADPVNLKHALGNSENKLDADRIRVALAAFAEDSSSYETDVSKAIIWERIVRAAKEAGVEYVFSADNGLDALLPKELQDELTKDLSPDGESPADESDTKKEEDAAKDAEFLALLDSACETVDGMLIDSQIDSALETFVSAPDVAPGSGSTQKSAESGNRSDAPSDNETELQKQLNKEREERKRLEQEVNKSREQTRKHKAAEQRLRASVGKSSALSYGEVEGASTPDAQTGGSLWVGDLAAEAAQE